MNDNHPTRPLGKGMFIAAWLVVLCLLGVYFAGMQERQINPNQKPGGHSDGKINQVVLKRNRHHHYVANGKINQQNVTFMVDTGATVVSLSPQLAAKLGLKAGARGYAHTANGTTETRAARIDTLQLGSITLHDVPASITFGMQANDAILLGMSALKDIAFTHRDGTLTLTQYR